MEDLRGEAPLQGLPGSMGTSQLVSCCPWQAGTVLKLPCRRQLRGCFPNLVPSYTRGRWGADTLRGTTQGKHRETPFCLGAFANRGSLYVAIYARKTGTAVLPKECHLTYLKCLDKLWSWIQSPLFQTSTLTLQSLESALETLRLEALLKMITSFREQDITCWHTVLPAKN